MGDTFDYLITLAPQEVVEGIHFGNVPDDLKNAAPVFTSERIVDAFVGSEYRYEMTASDPENDSLTFSLSQNQIIWPEGFSPSEEAAVYLCRSGYPYQWRNR